MPAKTANAEASATLEIVAGRRAGETITLGKGSFVIGSDEAATITCADPEVEWSHARIYRQRDRYWIEDLQSGGGVFVNEVRVSHHPLAPGDLIGIGQARFRFTWDGGPEVSAEAEAAAPSKSAAGGPSLGSESVREFVAKVVAGVGERGEPGGLEPGNGEPGGLEPGNGEPGGLEPGDGEAAAGAGETALIAVPPEGETALIAVPSEFEPAAGEAAAAAPASSLDQAIQEMEEARQAALDASRQEAAEADDLSRPATADDLLMVIEALREQNADLKVRLETAEGELQRKREGLSLATESFVEQLERAKERIANFAKRHAETEALVRTREEELEKLRAEHQALEQVSAARVRDLIDKLEAVRRDFDDLARLAAQKGQSLTRTVGDAKAATKDLPQVASGLLAAVQQAAGVGPFPIGPGAAVSVVGIDDLTASTVGRRSGGTAVRTARPPSGAAPALAAASLPPGAAEGAAMQAPVLVAGGQLDRILGPIRRALGSDALRLAAVFLIIAGAAFVVIWLARQPDWRHRGGETTVIPPAPTPSPATNVFVPVVKPAGERPAPAPVPARPAPAAAARPSPLSAQPAPVVAAEAANDAAEGDLFEPLRRAHRLRDERAIREAEQALIAKGAAILPQVNDAYQKERQFNVKVSLQFVALALEGKSGARDIVDAMRVTKDPGEKMRLAFMLGKLNSDSDLPFLEDAAQREEDPMIKKYIVRALGNIEGPRGMQVLTGVAQSSADRNLRIEAIRAIEEKGSAESSSFLMELARTEQDASIRSITIRALANTAGRESMSFFTQVLEQDERTNNRAEAAKYMGRVGEASDVQLLESVFERERVYYIRQKIRQAIDAMNRRAGVETPPQPVQ